MNYCFEPAAWVTDDRYYQEFKAGMLLIFNFNAIY